MGGPFSEQPGAGRVHGEVQFRWFVYRVLEHRERIATFIREDLRPLGRFVPDSSNDGELLARAWSDAAAAGTICFRRLAAGEARLGRLQQAAAGADCRCVAGARAERSISSATNRAACRRGDADERRAVEHQRHGLGLICRE